MKKLYFRAKALLGLRKKYALEIAVDNVLREWISDCIIERKQEGRRKEFEELRKKIEEEELFYKWLKSKKIWQK